MLANSQLSEVAWPLDEKASKSFYWRQEAVAMSPISVIRYLSKPKILGSRTKGSTFGHIILVQCLLALQFEEINALDYSF